MNTNLYFAWAAWATLLIIVLVRPLADIAGIQFLRKATTKRKQIGWLCGLMVVLHVVFYAINFNQPLTFFLNSGYWNLSTGFGWGLVAFFAMLPPLITSNNLSLQILKKNWKRLQRFTYLFFVASGIHIYLIGGKWLLTIVPIGIWFIVWLWSYWIARRE